MAASHLLPVLLLGTSVAALMTSAQPLMRFPPLYYQIPYNAPLYNLLVAIAVRAYNDIAHANSQPRFTRLRVFGVWQRTIEVAVPAVVPAVVPHVYGRAFVYVVALSGQMRNQGQQSGGPGVSISIRFAFWANDFVHVARIIPGTYSVTFIN